MERERHKMTEQREGLSHSLDINFVLCVCVSLFLYFLQYE